MSELEFYLSQYYVRVHNPQEDGTETDIPVH